MQGLVVGFKSRRARNGPWFVRLVVLAALVGAHLGAAVTGNSIALFPIESSGHYPDATEPSAIQYACSNDSGELTTFFSEHGLPVDPALMRPMRGYVACHVFYQPSLAGFRASPDNEQIQGLFAVPDPLSFLINPKPVGQSYDIIRSVLSRIERPLNVTLGLALDFGSGLWLQRENSPFRDSIHSVGYSAIPTGQDSPWVQDYFKAGKAAGRLRVLVPRHLFEGQKDNIALYAPLLDSLRGEPYVRSKLSWEGGDIQFVGSPRSPGSLLLFFGESSVDYWGDGLDRREVAYILRLEFGADHAVDLSAIGPHADYLVAFLPDTKTALVSQPVTGNYKVALAAAKEIKLLYGEQTPKELLELIRFLETAFNGLVENPAYVSEQVHKARPRFEAMQFARSDALQKELDLYREQYCPADEADCLSLEGQRTMIEHAPVLLRRLFEEGNDTYIKTAAPSKLLDLISVQLPGELDGVTAQLDAKAAEIQKLGFRVIRAPYLYTANVTDDWAGISQVNLLACDRKLFVPTFGLGEVEERLLAGLQKKLKQDYEVIPVYARFSLLLNGGVHCLLGITRDAGSTPLPRLTQLRTKPTPLPAAPEVLPIKAAKRPPA